MVKKKLIWSEKPAVYRTSTFQGTAKSKQAYLCLVTEEMLKLGCRRADEMGERNPYLEGSDRIFGSPDRTWLTGIRAFTTKEKNLRVGFSLTLTPRFFKIYVFLFGFAVVLGILSIYLSLQIGLIDRSLFFNPIFGLLIFCIIFSIGVIPGLVYARILGGRYAREIKQILIRTAESLGSKQATPFSTSLKRTTVDLEED